MKKLRKIKPRRRRVSRRAKRGTHVSVKGGTFNYRSGWELAFALWLDAQDDVLTYRYEPYFIEYLSNYRTKKMRKYYPDFEVTKTNGVKTLIEIKPKKKVNVAKNVKKFTSASTYCLNNGMTFVVVTEVELKALGLLK